MKKDNKTISRRKFLRFASTSAAGIALAGFPFASSMARAETKEVEKPNIIFILADDLGYGDLGCYGQKKIKTPNLDKMANEGMRFTNHYSGSTVCAPSRSCLMTGQHTGHTPIRGNKEYKPEGQHPMGADALTVAEVLKKAGYTTGAFGKWGLGFVGTEGDPNNQGFDEFFGYNCQRVAHRYYPEYLWHNDKKVKLPGNDWTNKVTYGPDAIQEKTLEFIEKNHNKPFFCYVPHIIPHAEILVPEDEIFKSYEGTFKEEPFVSEHEGAEYGKDLEIRRYASQSKPHAAFASMITRLDKHIGEIIQKVKDLGIEENTLIIFSSDNGPHKEGGADPWFFNSTGNLRGIKRDLYEGGIRIPIIARWPGKIKPGRVTDHISAFWDIMPTVAEIAQTQVTSKIDGISFLPTLLGKNNQIQHDYLYWEFHEKGGKQAVRLGNWKGVRLNMTNNPAAPIELYDLENDIEEKNNIANRHPDIVQQIKVIMQKAHIKDSDFAFEYEQ